MSYLYKIGTKGSGAEGEEGGDMERNWRKWLVTPLWGVWALILISTVNPSSVFGPVVIIAGLLGGLYALCLWAKLPMDKD